MCGYGASAWHTSITELYWGSQNRFSLYCSGSIFHSIFLQGVEGIHIFIQSLYFVQRDSGRQTRKAVYEAAQPEAARWDPVPAPPGKTNTWPQRQHAAQLYCTRLPLKCVSIPPLPAGLVLCEEWEKRGREGRAVVATTTTLCRCNACYHHLLSPFLTHCC